MILRVISVIRPSIPPRSRPSTGSGQTRRRTSSSGSRSANTRPSARTTSSAENVIPGDPVLGPVQAAGVGGHIAADGRHQGRRRGSGRVEEAVLGQKPFANPRRPLRVEPRPTGPAMLTSRILFIRAKSMTSPPRMGTAMPVSPVPAPRAVTGRPSSWAQGHNRRRLFGRGRPDHHPGAGWRIRRRRSPPLTKSIRPSEKDSRPNDADQGPVAAPGLELPGSFQLLQHFIDPAQGRLDIFGLPADAQADVLVQPEPVPGDDKRCFSSSRSLSDKSRDPISRS